MTTFDIIHIDETDSTNRWIKNQQQQTHPLPLPAGRGESEGSPKQGKSERTPLVVVTDYQTAGRGQGTNSWESERGKNLTFSVMIHPTWVQADRQFLISMAISVALVETLKELGDVSIKWPNDIYIGNQKICGILIENTLTGSHIKDCIIGIGLNVNQTVFVSDAPNPTSMALESGHEWEREEVLQSVLTNFGKLLDNWNAEEIRASYRRQLYRREGVHRYRDAGGVFEARMVTVEDDGHLVLRDAEGRERRYAFKEVAPLLSPPLGGRSI